MLQQHIAEGVHQIEEAATHLFVVEEGTLYATVKLSESPAASVPRLQTSFPVVVQPISGPPCVYVRPLK